MRAPFRRQATSKLKQDEILLLRTRAHWKVLFKPVGLGILSVIGLIMAVVLLQLYVPPPASEYLSWGIGLATLYVLLRYTVLPVLRWWADVDVITDRRIISRHGLWERTGHDLPLARINDVSYKSTIIDRLLGSGTIVLQTAAEQPLTINDIPNVQDVHMLLGELLYGNYAPQHTMVDTAAETTTVQLDSALLDEEPVIDPMADTLERTYDLDQVSPYRRD